MATVINRGTWKMHGSGGVRGMDVFHNLGTIDLKRPLTIPPNGGVDPGAAIRMLAANVVNTAGIIRGVNLGFMIGQAGVVSNDGASLVATGAGNVVSHDGASVVSHDGASVVSHDGASIVTGNIGSAGAGNLIREDAHLVATGAGNRPAGPATSGFTQTGGETDLSSVSIVGLVTLNGGVLSGSGVIDGDLTNNGGFVAPEHVAVTGNFTQGANGTLILRNGGALPNQYDQLQMGGTANLGGKLDLKTINGYTPDVADTFSPLGATSVSGAFASVSANAHVTMGDGGILVTDDITQPEPGAGQPLNISTRMKVLSGDNVLIAGFIVTGPSGSTKKVLIRGMGPSLAQAGVPGTLSDPFLELHNPDGSVVTNDNWADAPNVGRDPARL